jgi:hypothetical protein
LRTAWLLQKEEWNRPPPMQGKRPMWAALTRGMGFGQVSTKK